jgi:hypothetical protein
MPTEPVAKKAAKDIVRRSRSIANSYNKLWNAASKAPMYCKVFTKKGKDANSKKTITKTVKRTQRLISGHAYGIASTGAAQAIAREQQIDCERLGVEFDRTNDKGTPVAQAQLTPAFKFMVEQFMCSYVQECVYAARTSMQAVGKHTRLNRGIMKLACSEVNEQLFAASGLAPRNVYVVPLLKKKKDEDFKPASKEDQVAEEEADDDAAAAASRGEASAEAEAEA